MEEINIQQVLEWAGSHILVIVAVLGIFFEITPIKFNPITMLIEYLFKPIRKEMTDMKEELNKNMSIMETNLKQEIDSIKQEQNIQNKTIEDLISVHEMNEISSLRWDIIEFSNSIDNSQLHSRDEYRHIKDSIKRYHELIEKHSLTNGVIDDAVEKINSHYEKHKNTTSVFF